MGKYKKQKNSQALVTIRSSRDFPKSPSIAVLTGAGAFGVGHARIFIAVMGVSSDTMNYWTTDLQGDADEPAKIYLEEATSWADPTMSRTWTISQLRAENALAVAKQYARVQSDWTPPPKSQQNRVRAMVAYHNRKAKAQQSKKHVPMKYGKKGTFWGKLYKSKSRYSTCASYAQRILLAAGIPAPKYLFMQTGMNLVSHDRNLLTAVFSLLRRKPKVPK
ncbi:MAG: hypothetical protein ACYTFK_11760 [Planctomycetota bacterium]|jgi:hypothetical protein